MHVLKVNADKRVGASLDLEVLQGGQMRVTLTPKLDNWKANGIVVYSGDPEVAKKLIGGYLELEADSTLREVDAPPISESFRFVNYLSMLGLSIYKSKQGMVSVRHVSWRKLFEHVLMTIVLMPIDGVWKQWFITKFIQVTRSDGYARAGGKTYFTWSSIPWPEEISEKNLTTVRDEEGKFTSNKKPTVRRSSGTYGEETT
jgi:hypothetical protein